ncbi:MAG: hypothetical protein RLY20_404, partial [Verrucomicrobiota bacterium]
KDYITEWGYEVASHGSVPFDVTLTKVQTPRRDAAKPKAANPKTTSESNSH